MRNKTAVITGASTGLGKYLAAECALNGYNLLLVALPDTGLEQVAGVLRFRFQVEIRILETDLGCETAAAGIAAYCREQQLDVAILVNNAGLGFECGFPDLSADYCSTLMKVNMLAAVRLCHCLLSQLKECDQAYILNISSLASFAPMPYKGLYAASKAFLRSFSVSLRAELRHSRVSVSVICPGAVPTNDVLRKRIRDHGRFAAFSSYQPDELAKIAIRGMLEKKSVMVPGWTNKLSALLMQVMPLRLSQPFLYRRYSSVLHR